MNASEYHIPELISEESIQERIAELAHALNTHYHGMQPIILCNLIGAFRFYSDLIREMTIPLQTEFISFTRYFDDIPDKTLTQMKPARLNLHNRHCILIDDIWDHGTTLNALMHDIQALQPASLYTAVLLNKSNDQKIQLPIDWVGFSVPNVFVIGYGLDYKENYRYLNYIGILSDSANKT